MTIETITLLDVRPRPMAGPDVEEALKRSQVWLSKLELRRGERYLIEAESGTGKSSLCSFIYGNRCDYDGRILFNGKDISALSVDEWCSLRRTSLAILPQEMRLFPELTVMENIELKNRLTRHCSSQEIADMLAHLQIADKADWPAARLSIGQQQRAALVRSLCQPFSFLLLDEPVSHLDARTNKLAARLIERKASEQGAAVIVTSVGNELLLEGPAERISL